MLLRTLVAATALLVSTATAHAGSVFFVNANTHPAVDATRDQAWQAAVGNVFHEFDLEEFGQNETIDALSFGDLTIDVGLEDGLGGTVSTVLSFIGGFGSGGGAYGTVAGATLLNKQIPVLPIMTFDFSSPVAGFGLWIFDDGSEDSLFEMRATEVGGMTSTSTLLDAGNGGLHFVEGFLGVTSDTGLTSVAVSRVGGTFFEVDHLQVAIPEPGTLALVTPAVLALITRRRRRSAEA